MAHLLGDRSVEDYPLPQPVTCHHAAFYIRLGVLKEDEDSRNENDMKSSLPAWENESKIEL